jgi:hypothetical protein
MYDHDSAIEAKHRQISLLASQSFRIHFSNGAEPSIQAGSPVGWAST